MVALSFLIIHADGTRSALGGLPLVHPTVICFSSSPVESAQSSALSKSVYDFLRALGPQVQPCSTSCDHDTTGVASCPLCSQPESIQVLVVAGGVALSDSDVRWWTDGRQANRRVLPVFRQGQHPETVLPGPFRIFNAAFWKDSAPEVAPSVLSAAGLTPESHRIFISYRRLETEALAEDLFDGLNRLGFDVFLDRFAIPAAVNFQRRLHQDLAEKSMVLLLESDRFGESQWTTEEITYCKRNELGLYALRLPYGMGGPYTQTAKLPDIPDDWREDLNEADFRLAGNPLDGFMHWGELNPAARDTITGKIRARHDTALLRRRENLRNQMLSELRGRGVLKCGLRADGLLEVESLKGTHYAVWITPRPPELADFHSAHGGCQFPPATTGVVVGLRNLLEPETKRRLKWLTHVCKLVLVDQGHIVAASRRIAEGTL